MQMIVRPTNMAIAFAQSVLKKSEIEVINVDKGTGNWIARSVISKIDGAVKKEPAWNASLSHSTYMSLKFRGYMR